jgi:hypothetical protein
MENHNENLLDGIEQRPSVVHVANLSSNQLSSLSGVDLSQSFEFSNENGSMRPLAMPSDASKNTPKKSSGQSFFLLGIKLATTENILIH